LDGAAAIKPRLLISGVIFLRMFDMNKFLCFLVTTMTFLISFNAEAQCSLSEVASKQQSYDEYVVSGVLKVNGKADVIKLTQSIIKANNGSDALDKFIAITKVKYPGYVLATSLVTPRALLLTYEPCNFDI
jgi:hypothetical protein